MAPSGLTPHQIEGYTVLPLSLPPLPSFTTHATHYLYLAPHQPKIPSPTDVRSLFLVNIPFDSTETHFKHLFSTQIDLPAGRIEEVQFEGQRRQNNSEQEPQPIGRNAVKKGKKRKRGSEGGNLENVKGAALPSVWDRELQTNGLTAVVLFVDRTSKDAALKAVNTSLKEGRKIVWGDAIEDKLPALGSASKSPPQVQVVKMKGSHISRIPQPSPSYLPRQNPAPRISQQFHDSVRFERSFSSSTAGETKTRS